MATEQQIQEQIDIIKSITAEAMTMAENGETEEDLQATLDKIYELKDVRDTLMNL